MKRFSIFFVSLCAVFITTTAQERYFTNISDKHIKTLQVRIANEPLSDPLIELGSPQQIEINFDAIDPGYNRYAYKLIHCDADWQRSNLSPIEYLDGFQGSTIEDFATSMGTTVQYTNYRLLLPNEDMAPKISGNYAVQVYEEDHPEQIVLTACFSVYEPMVSIAARVSSNTDIDTNQSHQQVSFVINHKQLDIPHPQSDLKIWVYQNNRRDNAVTGLLPMGMREHELAYTNLRQLIFPAGNEYRRMEFLSNKYNGMRIEGFSFHNPYYHAEVMPDQARNQHPYEYDQDQNGRYLVRCSNCSDPDTEADYYIVHFTLQKGLIPDGNVYLSSEIYNNVLDEKSRMGFNPEAGQYEKSVLLKQGLYNYQYLFVPNGETTGRTAPIEGDFFQTENQYSVYVYYRPMGSRYDRLIGVAIIKNEIPML